MLSLKKIFSSRALRPFEKRVAEINALEDELRALSDEDLKRESLKIREFLGKGEPEDKFINRSFALAREAAKRTLNQRPYDVQLLGGLVLNSGAIAEMSTGEGKTLAAVAPVYMNALKGEGVHVVTVNEYLARRDAVWMGQIYRFLGLSVACLVPNAAFLYDPDWKVSTEEKERLDKKEDITGSFLVEQDFLRPITRREAYLADITYGTNHEFGFDYLRDNLASSRSNQVQRGRSFAVIDEVDSILIDEARTPLIIAAPDSQSSEFYKTFARVVRNLVPNTDYTVDEKLRSVAITEEGIEKVEKMIGVNNIYAPENLRLVHYLNESLRAQAIFRRDKDYVVKNGEVVIVDEFTGRMLFGRRYNAGLHQAIEAKEGVLVKEESRTYAKISIQNYFRQYKKISGMTGTAQTSAEEFYKVYNLEVLTIPTNRPMVREDRPDLIYKNLASKWKAVIKDIREHYDKGQPVLVGTTSIEKNEHLSDLLRKEGIPHELLNAKNNEREGAIIAQAGKLKAVTVATNMAGRGVDIILGGNPADPAEAQKVRDLGGLYVVGTERHEARRIDNQLRGRSGRQGDPGSSQFYLSAEDDLLRIFGGDRLKNIMERFDVPEDMPIQFGFISKAVAEAQAKVEGANFDMRKHLLEYDDVLNRQRTAVYKRRQEIMEKSGPELASTIFEAASASLEYLWKQYESEAVSPEELRKVLEGAGIINKENPYPEEPSLEKFKHVLTHRSTAASMMPAAMGTILSILDMLWMTHLESLDALSESVGLRAYGQKDPLVEYRHEAHNLFKDFWNTFNVWVFNNIFRLTLNTGTSKSQTAALNSQGEKIGRNDPCPCGSGKKYKKCHGS